MLCVVTSECVRNRTDREYETVSKKSDGLAMAKLRSRREVVRKGVSRVMILHWNGAPPLSNTCVAVTVRLPRSA
jgi:hypothetical protein